MATAAGNYLLDSVGQYIFDAANDEGKCKEFFLGVRASSPNSVLVHVDELHKEGEFAGMPIGVFLTFRLEPYGIARVYAKGDGGDAIVDWCVMVR